MPALARASGVDVGADIFHQKGHNLTIGGVVTCGALVVMTIFTEGIACAETFGQPCRGAAPRASHRNPLATSWIAAQGHVSHGADNISLPVRYTNGDASAQAMRSIDAVDGLGKLRGNTLRRLDETLHGRHSPRKQWEFACWLVIHCSSQWTTAVSATWDDTTS